VLVGLKIIIHDLHSSFVENVGHEIIVTRGMDEHQDRSQL